ncbi:MAG TPA: protein kinase [Polyangiaceae bacterium]|nr:protein kinase [Polyangiaceae bacterium]
MTTGGNVGVGDLVDGKYRLLRVIGEGGWGVVFEGENVRTLKRVAIKLLRARPDLTADIRNRFEREAQAAGRIGSEHIVEVFDLGTVADGSHYMVMELLSGEDLASRLRAQGPLDATIAARIVLQVLEGLGAAHEAGIMHRDLKPENLFLCPTRSGEDFVKILDFGISKFTTPGMTSATMTGAVLGSPFYMAPEQARGAKNVDPRTDLYSVGTLLFECVTGRVPFSGDNFNDLMFKIALSPRPNPLDLRPDLDPALVPIILKSIQADANERFATADLFREALLGWLESTGAQSVRTPELRRGTRTTPRPSGQPAATPTHPHQRPQWNPATSSLEKTDPTPLSGSSSVGRESPRRKQTLIASAAVGTLVIAGAITSIAAIRHHRAAAAVNASSTEAPSATTPGSTAVAVPPVTRLPPAPETAAEPAPVAQKETAAGSALAAAGAIGAISGSAPALQPALHNAPRPPPSAPVHPAPSKSGSPAAPAVATGAEAQAAPTPAPTPKSVDSIEGRAIQTGL